MRHEGPVSCHLFVCKQFTDARKKIKTKFIDVPSMMELMNTISDSEQYKIMLFVNIVLKNIKTLKKVNADNLLNNEIGNIKKGTGRA